MEAQLLGRLKTEHALKEATTSPAAAAAKLAEQREEWAATHAQLHFKLLLLEELKMGADYEALDAYFVTLTTHGARSSNARRDSGPEMHLETTIVGLEEHQPPVMAGDVRRSRGSTTGPADDSSIAASALRAPCRHRWCGCATSSTPPSRSSSAWCGLTGSRRISPDLAGSRPPRCARGRQHPTPHSP